MRWTLWLPVIVGCGRAGFDPTPDRDAAADARVDASQGCEAPYVPTAALCVRLVSTPASWIDAERDCEDDAPDAHLVIIKTVAEHFTIHAVSQMVPDVWLGYSDRATEGTLAWVTAAGLDPTSNPCFFGPAAVNSAVADCVTQDATTSCGDWFYRSCDEGHAYVCQRDGSPPDPGNY